jgi:hypothetical protein
MNANAGVMAAADMFVGNPFSTRHTRPGAIPPLDSAGRPVDVAALCAQLAFKGGSAAIVGAHGSGKTTLLEALAREFERAGIPAGRVRLRARRDAVQVLRAILCSPAGAVLCVDSWERMVPVAAGLVRLVARAVGCNLLVTTHRPTALPTLVVCATTPRLLAAIVDRLPGLEQRGGEVIADVDIEAAFRNHAGNIRESLYELYDRFEDRTRRPPVRL